MRWSQFIWLGTGRHTSQINPHSPLFGVFVFFSPPHSPFRFVSLFVFFPPSTMAPNKSKSKGQSKGQSKGKGKKGNRKIYSDRRKHPFSSSTATVSSAPEEEEADTRAPSSSDGIDLFELVFQHFDCVEGRIELDAGRKQKIADLMYIAATMKQHGVAENTVQSWDPTLFKNDFGVTPEIDETLRSPLGNFKPLACRLSRFAKLPSTQMFLSETTKDLQYVQACPCPMHEQLRANKVDLDALFTPICVFIQSLPRANPEMCASNVEAVDRGKRAIGESDRQSADLKVPEEWSMWRDGKSMAPEQLSTLRAWCLFRRQVYVAVVDTSYPLDTHAHEAMCETLDGGYVLASTTALTIRYDEDARMFYAAFPDAPPTLAHYQSLSVEERRRRFCRSCYESPHSPNHVEINLHVLKIYVKTMLDCVDPAALESACGLTEARCKYVRTWMCLYLDKARHTDVAKVMTTETNRCMLAVFAKLALLAVVALQRTLTDHHYAHPGFEAMMFIYHMVHATSRHLATLMEVSLMGSDEGAIVSIHLYDTMGWRAPMTRLLRSMYSPGEGVVCEIGATVKDLATAFFEEDSAKPRQALYLAKSPSTPAELYLAKPLSTPSTHPFHLADPLVANDLLAVLSAHIANTARTNVEGQVNAVYRDQYPDTPLIDRPYGREDAQEWMKDYLHQLSWKDYATWTKLFYPKHFEPPTPEDIESLERVDPDVRKRDFMNAPHGDHCVFCMRSDDNIIPLYFSQHLPPVPTNLVEALTTKDLRHWVRINHLTNRLCCDQDHGPVEQRGEEEERGNGDRDRDRDREEDDDTEDDDTEDDDDVVLNRFAESMKLKSANEREEHFAPMVSV